MHTPARRAITLFEIIVALVVLSLVMGGLANLFVASKRWAGHSGSRLAVSGLTGYFFVQDFLNVTADEWGNNCLSNNSLCNGSALNYTVGPVTYSANYTTSDATDTARKVVLRISWNETTP